MFEANCGVCPVSKPGELYPHVCAGCGLPYSLQGLQELDYFQVLSVPKRFGQDLKALEKRYYELSRALHPDRYSSSQNRDIQARSIARMSLVNQAYSTLKNPDSLRAYLLTLSGIKASHSTTVAADLASIWFDLQDEIMESANQPERTHTVKAKVDAFILQIKTAISGCKQDLGRLEDQYDSSGGSLSVLSDIQAHLNRKTTLESLLRDVQNQCRVHFRS